MPSAHEETPSSPPPGAQQDIDDLAIIGAGPTGLFAAFYAGLRQMRTKLIASLEILGGQLPPLSPEKLIYDVPGFPAVLAKDLAKGLIDQALQYRPTVCLGEQVRELVSDEQAGSLRLVTDKATHHARAILIAAGVGAFQAKTLPMDNAKQYEGRGLYYFVKELSDFADKRVLIVGGGGQRGRLGQHAVAERGTGDRHPSARPIPRARGQCPEDETVPCRGADVLRAEVHQWGRARPPGDGL